MKLAHAFKQLSKPIAARWLVVPQGGQCHQNAAPFSKEASEKTNRAFSTWSALLGCIARLPLKVVVAAAPHMPSAMKVVRSVFVSLVLCANEIKNAMFLLGLERCVEVQPIAFAVIQPYAVVKWEIPLEDA
ncbi:MAG: hypothetical protein NZM37_02820 [Sandaracinaceae bacterium]|nr:hypothetical protein [Sandaracinaceae bacterium]